MQLAAKELVLLVSLQEADAKSQFRCFEVCSQANGQDEGKQLLHLLTLRRG